MLGELQRPWLDKARVLKLPVAIIVPILVIQHLRRKRARTDTAVKQLPSPTSKGNTRVGVAIDDTWEGRPDPRQLERLASVDPLSVVLLELKLDIDVKKLWLAVMTDSAFNRTFQQQSKYTEVMGGHWHKEGKELIRSQQYTTPVKKNRLGPKEAWCQERQVCHTRSSAGFLVVSETQTPKVPYGSAFFSRVQWLAQCVGNNQTSLRVTAEVNFVKRCMLKGLITKATIEGMQDSYKVYEALLLQQLGMLQQGKNLTYSNGLNHKQLNLHAASGGTPFNDWDGSTEATAVANVLLQWLALFAVCALAYCWWHALEPPWIRIRDLSSDVEGTLVTGGACSSD